MKAQKAVLIFMLICVLIFLCDVTGASDDCDLPFGDPPCECCSEKWEGDAPPTLGYIVFQDIERTDYDPVWVMLPPPNNRLFELRRVDPLAGNTCAWSYNLDDVGGEGGVDSDIWVIGFDLTAYYSYNVYLANKVDDCKNPDDCADMIYFWSRGHTDCNTVYANEANRSDYFFKGGTAEIFWLGSPNFGDFNGDGVVNFEDYAVLVTGPLSYRSLQSFARNWLFETIPGR
ncbi:hypothetical protein ES707_10124 [subsurface metagenome]